MQPETLLRDAILDGPFSFTPRPQPIPGDLRMAWGISVLLLALANSRGQKANFQKLQFLAHSVRSPEGRADVRALMRRELRPIEVSVRVEPWLNRAVSFAHSQSLVSVDRGKTVSLTPAGVEAAKLIAAGEALGEEAAFVKEIAPKLTDALVAKIWRMEDLV